MNNFGDAYGKECQLSFSSVNLSPLLTFSPSPLEQLKSTGMLSFNNPNSPTGHRQYYGASDDKPDNIVSPANISFFPGSRISQDACFHQNYAPKVRQGNKKATKQPSYSQDHTLAEKKRREKLNQRFIALSAVIPNLKKLNKASILEDSTKYVKELQQRVRTLEEQSTMKKTMESVVFVKNSTRLSNVRLPEIETRVSEKNVLIRIHCEKQKGFLVKALAEIEKLNLSVVNSCVTLFGSTQDITVVAQMDEEFDMAMMDVMKKLRSSFQQFK